MKKNLVVMSLMIFLGMDIVAQSYDGMLMPAENPIEINLAAALNYALERSSSLKKAQQQLTMAQSEGMFAARKMLPTLSLQSGYDVIEKTGLRLGFKASLPLFDAQSAMELKAKNHGLELARTKFLFEKETLLFDVANLYIEALIALGHKNNAYEENQVYQRQIILFERMANAGSARVLDVSKAHYLAAKSYSDFLLKEQDFQKKMAELGKKIGIKEMFNLAQVNISSPHFDKDVAILTEMASTAHEIMMAKSELFEAESELRSEVFGFLPKMTAQLDSGWLSGKNELFAKDNFRSTLMINLELPLFSGLTSLAALKQKTAQKTIHEISLRSKLSEKTATTYGLMQQITTLGMVNKNTETALDFALKTKESAERLFEKGHGTTADLDQANVHLFNAKNQLTDALLRLEQVKLKLLFIIGRMSDLLV